MALAILRFQDSENGKHRFQVELGKNRFYRYAIGGQEVMRKNGLVQLQPVYTSRLIGPLPESSLERTILEVPQEQFDRQHRCIQITSFQTAQLAGPALSEIITVPSIGATAPAQTSRGSQDLPAISFNLAADPPMKQSLETVAFQYREVPPNSETMRWDDLKSVGRTIKNAIKGAAASDAGRAAIETGSKLALEKLKNSLGGTITVDLPQLMEIIIAVFSQAKLGSAIAPTSGQPMLSSTGAVRAQGAAGAMAFAQSAGYVADYSPDYVADYAVHYSSGYDFAALADLEYADAHSLAALDSNYASAYGSDATPAYLDAYSLSLLEDADPDVYEMALASRYSLDYTEVYSSEYTGTMASDFQRISRMMELDEDEAAEDQAVLVELALALAASDLVFRRVDAVTLAFSQVSPLTVRGKSCFLYRQDQDICFPLSLNTPKPIKKAKLQLLLKHPKTLQVLLEQKYELESAASGDLTVIPKFSKEQLKTLAPNQDYLICVVLLWQGRSKQTSEVMTLGTDTMQLITLTGEYVFDRIESTGETVPLNDVDRFRLYWHKVWQGDFTDDTRRIEFQCKYYYALEPNRSENARMETVTQVTENDMAVRKSRLKSGLIVTPHALNDLLGQLGKHPRLSEAELLAFKGTEFQGRFHHAARTGAKFKGKPGQTAALWVYPEVKLQQVILQKVENTNANGLVQALRDHPVYFPMPAIAHFIGVSTEQ